METVSLHTSPARQALKEELAGIERETITRALAHFKGNISLAAKHLNIARSTLRDRLKKLGIKARAE